MRIALSGAVAGACCLSACSAARAGDDDVSSKQSFTDKFMNTLGLKNPFDPQYGINYSERSPLVVPPTRRFAAAAVPPNGPPVPNWPVDPEIKARAAAKQDEKVSPKPDYVNGFLSAPTASRASSMPALSRSRHQRSDFCRPTAATKKAGILNFDWLKQEDYGTFTGEPPRVSLTDPPPGYQTPSTNQPYGIVPEKKIYKPPTLGERMEPVQ